MKKVHKDIQEKLAEFLRSQGYKVGIEVPRYILYDVIGYKKSNPAWETGVRIQITVDRDTGVALSEKALVRAATMTREVRKKVR